MVCRLSCQIAVEIQTVLATVKRKMWFVVTYALVKCWDNVTFDVWWVANDNVKLSVDFFKHICFDYFCFGFEFVVVQLCNGKRILANVAQSNLCAFFQRNCDTQNATATAQIQHFGFFVDMLQRLFANKFRFLSWNEHVFVNLEVASKKLRRTNCLLPRLAVFDAFARLLQTKYPSVGDFDILCEVRCLYVQNCSCKPIHVARANQGWQFGVGNLLLELVHS